MIRKVVTNGDAIHNMQECFPYIRDIMEQHSISLTPEMEAYFCKVCLFTCDLWSHMKTHIEEQSKDEEHLLARLSK